MMKESAALASPPFVHLLKLLPFEARVWEVMWMIIVFLS
jgi:hypothetical protein